MSSNGIQQKRGKVTAEILRNLCQLLEFVSRFIMVNIPTYVQVVFPEFDRVCSLIFAYFTFQVVGFAGACLTNAAFTLACRITTFLPPNIFNSAERNVYNYQNGSYSTFQVLAIYYISYASVRVMVTFTQGIFHIGLESIKDFPDASRILASGGLLTLKMAPVVFTPVILLEISLILSDPICHIADDEYNFDFFGLSLVKLSSQVICEYTGMRFLTSSYFEIQRLVLIALIVMVIQLWQAALLQFPRWSYALRELSLTNRILSQIAILSLFVSTMISFAIASVSDKTPMFLLSILLLGWTSWLCMFVPILVKQQGVAWAAKVSQASLQIFAATLRLTFIVITGTLFLISSMFPGLQRAQLDFIFVTFALPAVYCSIYLSTTVLMQAGTDIILWGLPVAFICSFLINALAATPEWDTNGKGNILLVTAHLLSKIAQYFGDDDPLHGGSGEHDWEVESDGFHEAQTSEVNQPGLILDDSLREDNQQPNSNQDITADPVPIASLLSRSLQSQSSLDSFTSESLRESLADRGLEQSSLVSLGPISHHISDNLIVRWSRRHLRFLFAITRTLAVSDSALTGIIRAFIGIGVVFTVMVLLAVVGSLTQQRLHMFPRLVDFKVEPGQYVHFNHRISNATLYYTNSTNNKCISSNPSLKLHLPYYAACDWKWETKSSSQTHKMLPSLSLIDFALLSELAYYDADVSSNKEDFNNVSSSSDHYTIQSVVDILFPEYNFEVLSQVGLSNSAEGPMYMELHSDILNLTVVAVRGTDIGRIHDFLEDIKLYAEPVLFTILSTIFPTIRFWTSDTTSRVIEWLYRLNSFLGVQSESLYYRPLVSRISEIVSNNTNSEKQVVITGHSLGGGLSRIVGSLTNTASITFGAPGLGLSYRKYAFNSDHIYGDEGGVHHRSVSVISEFDWISQVDRQVGLVQTILCDKPAQFLQNSCHALEGTICHLVNHCGDKINRFINCEYEFDLSSLAPQFRDHAWILVPPVLLISILVGLAILPDIL